ncbi:ketopantoate reductase family protein [Pseudoalteromonas phenolica]|uniref:ketopantoate reductase family protein n=1 Tax=Pseudoalteromonas phenolica TaxID=161398 RepID=UPI00110C0940|nr:2-dehydropantoate 2-reductase [Pseudoalteromonas phenolica]TMO55503.1 2-dehydropantoate 2-reductase [Pseudoalteromonas phenolica]
MANVHILGAGAVGLSFAFHLSQYHEITLLTRSKKTDTFYYQENEVVTPIATDIADITSLTPQDTISICFICVKAYQLIDAFNAIQPFLAPEAKIIISHNGITDLTELTSQLNSSQSLFFMSTSRGALKPSSNTVVQTGIGATYLGACNTEAENNIDAFYEEVFSKSIAVSAIHKDMALLRWQKLMVNIAINPLTALHQVQNGQLLKPSYATQVINLLNEACFIANKLGIDIALADALNSAYTVMRQTRFNNSSMAQDVKLGRKTEIEAICGYIVSEAKKLGLDTPYNRTMLEQINHLEQTS